jgi:hypothetical protein
MAISDKELLQKQQHVEKLREQLATAESTRMARENERGNEIVAVQLDAEAARLEAQLAEAKRLATVSAVKEGASGPLDAAREDLASANAYAAAQDAAKNGGNS